MVVNPGDIVVGDADGLLTISPTEDVRGLIDKARAVLESETKTMRAMREGRWDRSFIDALEARSNNCGIRAKAARELPADRPEEVNW